MKPYDFKWTKFYDSNSAFPYSGLELDLIENELIICSTVIDSDNYSVLTTNKLITKENGTEYIGNLTGATDNGFVYLKDYNKDNKTNSLSTEIEEKTAFYQNIEYDIVINVPNFETALASNNILVSSGTEIEDDEENNIDDYIESEYFANDNWHDVMIGELDVIGEIVPLFVVTVHSEEIDMDGATTELIIGEEDEEKSSSLYRNYLINNFKIKYRYERAGKSEFYIIGYEAKDDGTGYSHIFDYVTSSNASFSEKRSIESVKKRNIGKTRYPSYKVFNKDYSSDSYWNSEYVYFNTFERDWYASQKYLGNTPNNVPTLYGNMKYNNEWYTFNPATSYTQRRYKKTGSSNQTFTNYKGHINIRRY